MKKSKITSLIITVVSIACMHMIQGKNRKILLDHKKIMMLDPKDRKQEKQKLTHQIQKLEKKIDKVTKKKDRLQSQRDLLKRALKNLLATHTAKTGSKKQNLF